MAIMPMNKRMLMVALIISLLRQAVIVLPLVYIFSKVAIQNASFTWMIWTVFPITELLCAVIAGLFMKKIYRKKLHD